MATLKNTVIEDTSSLKLPVGTTTQRTTGNSRDVRFNSSHNSLERFDGTRWRWEYVPDVVTDGLVLYLDAEISADRINNVWRDLSFYQNHATLYTTPSYSLPTYNAIGERSYTFNSNNYAECVTRRTQLELQPNQGYTLIAWIKVDAVSALSGAIISNMTAAPFPGYDLWFNGSDQIASHLISSWTTNAIKIKIDYPYSNLVNVFNMIAVTYNGSTPTTPTSAVQSIDFYINGDLYTTGKDNNTTVEDAGFDTNTTTIPYTSNQRFRVGSRWASNDVLQGSSFTISAAQVYNKKLSAAEISQNFNALRWRFNI
jgi:hypothetical protein